MNAQEKATNYAMKGIFTGLLAIYPVSYRFQPDALRLKLSLTDYLGRMAELLDEPELRPGIVLSLALCPLVRGLGGRGLGKFMAWRR